MTACLASHHAALPCTCEQMELRAEVIKLRAALAESMAFLRELNDDDAVGVTWEEREAKWAALKAKVAP